MSLSLLNIPEEVIVHRTVHGSFLYGLNHVGSDKDFYIVVQDGFATKANGFHRPAVQIIHDDVDLTVLSFSEFMSQVYKGVPQAVEALMSGKADICTVKDFFAGYRVQGSDVIDRYARTVKSFALDERDGKQPKLRKHSVRLALNLLSLIETGRFNPTVSAAEKEIIETVGVKEFPGFSLDVNRIVGFNIF